MTDASYVGAVIMEVNGREVEIVSIKPSVTTGRKPVKAMNRHGRVGVRIHDLTHPHWLRDLETIRLALTAAETGHLVFGTLHTSSAAKTIDRVVDVFPAAEKEMVRSMLSESLRAVISQTLLKTKDGSGRVAAHEIMIGTPAIRNLIRENKVAQMYSAIQTGQNVGMQTLDQCLVDMVRRNLISSNEARQKAANKEAFPA